MTYEIVAREVDVEVGGPGPMTAYLARPTEAGSRPVVAWSAPSCGV